MSALARKVELSSTVAQVVERLETAIFGGELLPGERLREARVAIQLGVGRGVVREAVRQLEGRRLLVHTPNLGSRVAEPSEKEVADSLDVREALEGAAARLAARHITADELMQLRVSFQGQQTIRDSGELIAVYRAQLPSDFHFIVAYASRNERLLDLLYGDLFYFLRLHRYRATLAPGRSAVGRQEHEAIIAALAAGDSDGAEAAMREHLRHSHRMMLQTLGPQPRPA